jgi:hypothetical protein
VETLPAGWAILSRNHSQASSQPLGYWLIDVSLHALGYFAGMALLIWAIVGR